MQMRQSHCQGQIEKPSIGCRRATLHTAIDLDTPQHLVLQPGLTCMLTSMTGSGVVLYSSRARIEALTADRLLAQVKPQKLQEKERERQRRAEEERQRLAAEAQARLHAELQEKMAKARAEEEAKKELEQRRKAQAVSKGHNVPLPADLHLGS